MGIRNAITKAGNKAADKVAKLSALSPEQLELVQGQREDYLSEMPDPTDQAAQTLTRRLLAAGSVEIYKAYLTYLKDLYVPVEETAEYGVPFDTSRNIRFYHITRWVTDKNENSLEKLVNVYEVLSNEDCNIGLVFHRTCETTHVYLAVTNTRNANNNVDSDNFWLRLGDAIRGNFPGSEWEYQGMNRAKSHCTGVLPCMQLEIPYSVAIASNVPAEKSEKFISQTIEKLLDGIVPDTQAREYILILLATPVPDVENRKLALQELYSALAPYASWTTTFTYDEHSAMGSSATVGVNIGASAGVQNGTNQSTSNTEGTTDSSSESTTDSIGSSDTQTTGTTTTDSTGSTSTEGTSSGTSSSSSHSEGTNESYTEGTSQSQTLGGHAGIGIVGVNYSNVGGSSTSSVSGSSVSDALTSGLTESATQSVAQTTSKAVATAASSAVTSTVGKAVASTLGKAVSNSVSKTVGAFQSTSFGVNFGASFARTSTVTATIGKSEGIQQSFTNYNIRHALENLEQQMKRLELSTALGLWDFAAYVMSEDQNVASNVAHSYLALTQGEESYMSQACVNVWRGDMGEASGDAKEICRYLRQLRHPVFGLNPGLAERDSEFLAYPPIVTAATSLTGKELAYALNFPKKSIPGLPVLECVEFGRNVVTYDPVHRTGGELELGRVYHMHHEEQVAVKLAADSLSSHTFITGSTGSGKSNTVYQLLNEAMEQDVRFMVIEPAKGEYKHVFSQEKDVSVYGTNPALTPLLRINPFSFPRQIHILEHLDRLVEIFNVCWPMYAAMPAVLKSAVEQSYVDCGWDLVRSANLYGEELYPSFADVARNIRKIIDTSEYDAENKGAYKGSLLTRLESLTNGINGMIFTCDEFSPEDLFDRNVIVDLSRVGSSETKSLLMGMLVLKLQEHRMASAGGMNMSLRHVTVLEEAHNLLKRTSMEHSSESANLAGKSVEMLANAIAEMRTYGEGFIIADQAPGLLDLSVIRNTNTKIILRLPDQSDRELVGRAANLTNDQVTELAKLPCGVAAVYQNEWVQPVLCRVKRYDAPEGRYTCPPGCNDDYLDEKAEKVSEALLDCIMNKELYCKDERREIRRLTESVLRSKLDTTVKRDLLTYLSSKDQEAYDSLRALMYDLLAAGEPLPYAPSNDDDLRSWAHALADRLFPSIRRYTQEQVNLALAFILHEQAERDASYGDLLRRFTEIYIHNGGVY